MQQQPNFVLFTQQAGTPCAVNPHQVTSVFPHQSLAAQTIIYLTSSGDDHVVVNEPFESVMNRLAPYSTSD